MLAGVGQELISRNSVHNRPNGHGFCGRSPYSRLNAKTEDPSRVPHSDREPPPVTVFVGSAMGPPAFGSGMTSPPVVDDPGGGVTGPSTLIVDTSTLDLESRERSPRWGPIKGPNKAVARVGE
ncbi:hypothetical protein GCM10010365_46580 [Streptomyces poonensis]|uniref:Uncharacterized protein n=1 Tax=Streptomyces poonensis TaxID=68255 RepID=A0A918UMP2_9ACTN|nr:hypothetical protein GCM10010365_46580 [Streptomyces poonensis]